MVLTEQRRSQEQVTLSTARGVALDAYLLALGRWTRARGEMAQPGG